MCRAAATSGRLCSAARRSFFMRQTEVAQQPPDRATVHRRPMRHGNLGGQFRHSQVPLLADPAGDPRLQARQLAMTAAIALGFRSQTAGRPLQLDHVVDKLHRNPEPRRRRPMRVPLRDKIHHALSQLNRMRLAGPARQTLLRGACRRGVSTHECPARPAAVSARRTLRR